MSGPGRAVMALAPQSAAWRARCVALARARGLDEAAEWRASYTGAALAAPLPPPAGAATGVALRVYAVPSGSGGGEHAVEQAVAYAVATRRATWALRCSCRAGAYNRPCAHVGSVILAWGEGATEDTEDDEE